MGAGEIDRIAFFRIGFRFAGNDGGEVEDHVRPGGDRLCRCAWFCEIDRGGDDVRSAAGRPFRRDDVDERQARDRAAAERGAPSACGRSCRPHR